MRVGEALVDLLSTHYGVDVVFGIPGVHNIELYRGLERSRVRAISPRHEQGAGFMADGWSIVTGRPGVCVLISGPGVTNALTPIAQAYHDSRPMLVLASTTPTDALGGNIGPLHDLPDQAALVRSVCAFSETVTDSALSILGISTRLGHSGVTITTRSPGLRSSCATSISADTPEEVTAIFAASVGRCSRDE